MQSTPINEAVIDKCNVYRGSLLHIEEELKAFKTAILGTAPAEDPKGFDRGEVLAQLTISLRAVEDARMRLGKVIQYADGGTSVYDKPKEEEEVEE